MATPTGWPQNQFLLRLTSSLAPCRTGPSFSAWTPTRTRPWCQASCRTCWTSRRTTLRRATPRAGATCPTRRTIPRTTRAPTCRRSCKRQPSGLRLPPRATRIRRTSSSFPRGPTRFYEHKRTTLASADTSRTWCSRPSSSLPTMACSPQRWKSSEQGSLPQMCGPTSTPRGLRPARCWASEMPKGHRGHPCSARLRDLLAPGRAQWVLCGFSLPPGVKPCATISIAWLAAAADFIESISGPALVQLSMVFCT
mmetsp:Transcript_6679/g.20210  ORF Transcript_6679/g.20210 Transcript_6679/m.20210 type:complete len:253 (-) Transcript_6679:341-1099(-)